MKKVVKTYICDMCGAEFDPYAVRDKRLGATDYRIIVHYHNPNYDEGFRDGYTYEEVDLCPVCLDKACAIHQEWHKDDDGGMSTTLSWRDAK